MVVVPQSTEPLIESLLSLFNALLKNPDESDWLRDNFKKLLTKYATNREIFNRDFYTITLDTHPDVNILASQILDTLNIDPLKRSRYLGMPMTVYAFLNELNELPEHKNAQLNQFIQLIDQHNSTQWKGIVWGTILGSAIGLFPFFMYGLSAIQQFLTVASVIPAGGLAYAVGMGVYTLNDYNSSKKVSYYQLFKDNFFSMANAALSVTAWSLLFTAIATTSIVSVLFVLADVALVIKEFVSLSAFFNKNKDVTQFNLSLNEQHLLIREQVDFEQRRQAAWVHFTAAVVLTIIIAAWCFVPGGIFVPAACMLGMGIVYAVKHYKIRENEANMKALLDKKFSAVESAAHHTCDLIAQHNEPVCKPEPVKTQLNVFPKQDMTTPSNVLSKIGMFNHKAPIDTIEQTHDANVLNNKKQV